MVFPLSNQQISSTKMNTRNFGRSLILIIILIIVVFIIILAGLISAFTLPYSVSKN